MGVRELAAAMRGVINSAALAQKDNGVKFEPFNQYLMGYDAQYQDWLGAGMCRGLPVKYPVCQKSKEKFTGIVNAKSMNTFKLDKTGKLRADNPLQDEIFAAAVAGDTDGVGEAKDFYDFMKEKYKFKHDTTKSFTDGREAIDFATDTGKYSVILIPHHAMAAAGLADKSKAFLEPNCGIITVSKEGFLTAVDDFFSHDFVQKTYKMQDPKFSFTVHRFKT